LTFPTLLAVGYPPVLANVTNTVGLVPGSVSGAIGYRRELAGQRRRILQLVPVSVIGGLAGAMLLLAVPGLFRDVVPILILVAVYFSFATHVAGIAVVLLWISSAIGGQVGAHVGRRLPAPVLRGAIAIVGTAVAIDLLVS